MMATPREVTVDSEEDSSLDTRIFMGSLLIVMAIGVAVLMLVLDVSNALSQPVPSHEHGSGGAVIIHSANVIQIALIGLGAVAVGGMLKHPRFLRSRRTLGVVLAVPLLYVDGVIHWLAVSEHLAELPSAWFFVATGAVQIFLIPMALRHRRVLWWVGIPFTVFLLDLYAVTRIVPPPFATEPESTAELLGLLSKVAEFGLVGALALIFGWSILPSSLANPFRRGAPLATTYAAAFAAGLSFGIEATWGFVPTSVFLIMSLLLGGFVGSAALADLRKSRIAGGVAWSLVAILVLGHLFLASYYGALLPAGPFLLTPLLLCLAEGGLLGAPFVSSAGAPLFVRARGLVGL